MTQTASNPATSYPADLKVLLERAHAGDPTALPDVRSALKKFPEIARQFGDLAGQVETSLLSLVSGTSLLGQEAIRQQLEAMRAELGLEAATGGHAFPSFASSSSTTAKPSQGGDAKPWAPRGSPDHRRDEGLLHHVWNAAFSAALPFRRVNELPIFTEVKKRSAGHGRRQECSVMSNEIS